MNPLSLPCFGWMTLLLSLTLPTIACGQKAENLFDGKSLDGWETLTRDQKWWRVQDGFLAGGSLTQIVPHNTFVATEKSYQNFELKLAIRILGGEGFINSGIQIRSIRAPKGSEMVGYQVDAGDGWWGKLYDESRRNKVIAEAKDLAAVNAAIKKDDWNEFRIVAEGPRIRSWINGVAALDYTEAEAAIPLDGKIGIQVHGGGKALVQLKEITLQELPPTLDAPSWKERSTESPQTGAVPLSAEAELAGFQVPDGFEVELVASESEGIGKFVALAFDAKGRLWTTTALEYPVDANESPEESRSLFAAGGRDKVLVIDSPCSEKPSPPRVFAKGLVMPLGVLPYGDGAFVQYGHDIRFYRDQDQDGKADSHEIVLTGFGTQDSHLFPHQFTRVPGDWILMAQGLFNASTVRRANDAAFANGEKQIEFKHCKLGRFNAAGDRFEALTQGPNNIWGLTVSREGKIWIQEANDIGHPVSPFEPGAYYPTGSRDLLKSYQPLMPPPLGPPQMGGTGLSGLTLADDRQGWPSPWGFDADDPAAPRRFYVANPITSRIQLIEATFDGDRFTYKKRPDFLVSSDPRFRPVAIQFGPDGSLYVIDWYNKVISHNEVPRRHPDRDKTRGRIWRIRHKDQPRTIPVDLTQLTVDQLVDRLGDGNARIAELAWQQIIDRQAKEVIPRLSQVVIDRSASADRRLGALWALEGLTQVPASILHEIARAENANLRHEAVRIAAAQPRSVNEFLKIAKPLVNDSSPHVRAALGDALRRLPAVDSNAIALMLELGKASTSGDVWTVYDREFERFLARWAMEENREAVAAFLSSPAGKALPVENRALATLAIGGRAGAVALANLLPDLERPLNAEEIRVLVPHFADKSVAQELTQAIARKSSRDAMLRSFLRLRTQIDWRPLRPAIELAAAEILSDPAQTSFAFELIQNFQLNGLTPEVMKIATDPQVDAGRRITALQTLAELPSLDVEPLIEIANATGPNSKIREAAIRCLARSSAPAAADAMLDLLVDGSLQIRQLIVTEMSSHREGVAALLDAYDDGDLQLSDFSPETLQRMTALAPASPILQAIKANLVREGQTVLQLAGGANDFVNVPIDLPGPFTVETWVKLRPDISNADGILAGPGTLDVNFYNSTLRVWIAGQRDVAVADRKMLPDAWTHIAVTRDPQGVIRIYINGELSTESRQTNSRPFSGVYVGRTTVADQGTDGQLAEYRIWNVARSADEILLNFDRSFDEAAPPAGLLHQFHNDHWGKLSGAATTFATLDSPPLHSAEEAAQLNALFDRYRQLANRPGDLENGQQIFTKTCLTCHQFGGHGGNIGPALDGVGLRGTEAILRNVLTPSAAIEGGYRNYQVVTIAGQIYAGLLVAEDESVVVIRQLNAPDRRIEKRNIQRGGFTNISVMPEGLLNALSDQEVSDLFRYLGSLKQGVSSANADSASVK
ncbi:DUF1080 domain-containing protein [Blastopirellula sp. J2-11]|uniref:DUF7133 domain-containing protein n=1 Tax=Blastopirellula sp. J2-11 TaxID=2943192 RepID=UPI0021CAA0EA|nr:family 16 glycoside hydrolase [Blastopirellula sp. J2-11]UUO07168.1 DUF1080 domain-containing protein [Blastopirellula sp. J2-11]